MDLKKYFGSYKKSNTNQLIYLVKKLDSYVKKYLNFEKPFLKGEQKIDYYEYLSKCELNYESQSPDETFGYISPLFQNLPNWINPGTMLNVIPPVNLVSLASITYTNMFNVNFAHDNYAGLLLASELEVNKYISELAGWDWKKSHGIFTFGGKGTNLYATKIALNKADPKTMNKGCYGQYFMVTSEKAHPCHYEVCNWLGIGADNCIELPCGQDDKIVLEDAEKIICENIEAGKTFLGFNINGCSTTEFTVDPIKKIYDLNKKIVKKYGLDYNPHIHVDAVIGWVWLFFYDYDFENNPLNVPNKHLKKIKSLYEKISEIRYIDSIGVDFHKTGFCPYVSSLFLVKNRKDYYSLNPKKEIPLEELAFGNFAPFETSLELSRSASGAVSALTSLKSLGIRGFQKIVAKMFSTTEYFRNSIAKSKKICVTNMETEGFATLFILKPSGYYNHTLEQILNLPKSEVDEIKEYNIKFAKYVFEKNKKNEISYTFTSSRSYKVAGTNVSLGALKAYPLSVFLDKKNTEKIVEELFETIKEYQNIRSVDIGEDKYITDDMVYRNNKKNV